MFLRIGLETVPSLNFQPVIGLQAGWLGSSIEGLIGWFSLYGVSAPRSRRVSWMLLRARLAVMSVKAGHSRATMVTK